MREIPKYKIGTTIPIDKDIIINYFKNVVDFNNVIETQKEYHFQDNSILILKKSLYKNQYFVNFYIQFQVSDRAIEFKSTPFILKFFIENNSKIKRLNRKEIMYASEGALLSDIYHSRSFKIARHIAEHPKNTLK